jgi:hypothetical protein
VKIDELELPNFGLLIDIADRAARTHGDDPESGVVRPTG